MFKRRTPRSYAHAAVRALYPRGGWWRGGRYVLYRLRRLPDAAHRISRGIACGVFISFTPFFGLHFLFSAGLAWLIGGNVLAALLATFFGNPITFPIIAAMAVEIGSRMLGQEPVPLPKVVSGFSHASFEIWSNAAAMFTAREVVWLRLPDFLETVFWPYLVGGLVPGTVAGIVAYMLANPVIRAYQRGRVRRLKKRFEAREP